ncbi:MAG TPA: TetR/AcrR family transcriptional regulator [Actinomycetota bacterium]|nr:TetR/AcrR family transcriptional regulator [Actinomycetota bacterium]
MSVGTEHDATDAPAKGPGRPRDPEADRAILRATIELLAEEGYDGLSIEAVAARAGVGKTTVYRRWPSKEPLVVDAIRHYKMPEDPPAPRDDETTREALSRILGGFVKTVGRSESGRMMAGLVAEMARNPELATAVRAGLLQHRRGHVAGILERGIERGEVRSDVDLEVVADMLGGLIVMRVLLTGGSVNPALVRSAVDTVLDGIAVA